MNLRLTTTHRLIITFVCFVVALVGFMLKLPAAFRHIDKELHAAFYFVAAGFLNILFAKRNLLYHAAIFIILYLFGMAIEYGQAYSNRFFTQKIHGRFDPEDVAWNLKGLLAFSLVWLVYTAVVIIYKKTLAETKALPQPVRGNTEAVDDLLGNINNIARLCLQPGLQVINRDRHIEECLVNTYRIYFNTPDHFDGKEYPEFDSSILANTRQQVAANFKEFGFYKTILDINDFSNLTDVATGDAIDDLSDIINDLLEVKWRLEHNSIEDGLWYFKLIFRTHTQQHVLDLLNYMKQKEG